MNGHARCTYFRCCNIISFHSIDDDFEWRIVSSSLESISLAWFDGCISSSKIQNSLLMKMSQHCLISYRPVLHILSYGIKRCWGLDFWAWYFPSRLNYYLSPISACLKPGGKRQYWYFFKMLWYHFILFSFSSSERLSTFFASWFA